MENNLVEHARYELELSGEDPETIDGLLKVVQAFANMGHSGFSAEACTQVLEELLRYRNLTPLTDDPDEWIYHDEDTWGEQGGIWQNTRRPNAFSKDGGKTYGLVGEDDGIHNSEHKGA